MHRALGYALSDEDIHRLNPRTKLILYQDVKRFRNIEQLLSPFDSVIILYEWERTRDTSIGHYITVNRVGSSDPAHGPHGLIEHFDSYAIKPDKELDQLKNASPSFRKMTGQDQKYLLNLYAKSRSPISYNQYKLQSPDDSVATCGRYAVLRSKYRHMPLEEFAKIFTGKRETPDQIAVQLTEPYMTGSSRNNQ
jgi:hypothetical protein